MNATATLPFKGYEKLSDAEKKAFELLQQCSHNSIWNYAIDNVVKNNPDLYRFRSLICELKSQNEDNPRAMKTILGLAHDAVIGL